jgi:hypothetical protein
MCGRHVLVGRKQAKPRISRRKDQTILRKEGDLVLEWWRGVAILKRKQTGPLLHQFHLQASCQPLSLFLLYMELSLGGGESLEMLWEIDVRTLSWLTPPSLRVEARREARARTGALRSPWMGESLYIIQGYLYPCSLAGRSRLGPRLRVPGGTTHDPRFSQYLLFDSKFSRNFWGWLLGVS